MTLQNQSRTYGWARDVVYGLDVPGSRVWRGLTRPLGWVWGRAAGMHAGWVRRGAVRLGAPTIGVGNVVVGGGGKTSLVQWLLAEGLPTASQPAVLTRGYGRDSDGVRVVPPGARAGSAREAGDEAALIARAGAWVGVARRRDQAAEAVTTRIRPTCFVLDDALQHHRIVRDLDFVTFTAADLNAPARCLPAGPLRERVSRPLAPTVWIVTGDDPRARSWRRGTIGEAYAGWWSALSGTSAAWRDAGTVTLAGWVADEPARFTPSADRTIVFCGVARPRSVTEFAKRAGFDPIATIAFADHANYGRLDVRNLLRAHPAASFLTTEKDATKLDPAWFDGREVGVLRRRLVPDDADLLRSAVARVLGRGA